MLRFPIHMLTRSVFVPMATRTLLIIIVLLSLAGFAEPVTALARSDRTDTHITSQAQLSADATLSALSLSGTTFWHPSFSASATSYAVQVGADTSETMVTATANHRAASVDIERKRSWGAWTDADGAIPLEMGQNRVRVEVTAQDTTTTKTYYILITRTATPFPAALGELSTDDPPVNFRSTGSSHNSAGVQWEVPKGRHISQYKLTLYENSGSGFVDIGRSVDDEVSGGSSVGWSNLKLKADTQYRYDLELMNDARIAIIEASVTLRTETEPAPASSDATLSGLTLSGIDIGTFDSGTTSYAASVANSVSQTTVTPTLNDSGARYSIVANNTLYHSGTVQLRAGSNTIEVTVTAEDGQTRKTYTVTVTRAEESLLDRYDVNDDGRIDISEVFTAIDDYFDNVIDFAQLAEVIDLYFSSAT